MNNDPLDVDYDWVDNEERYRSVGVTNQVRLLSVIWTFRNDKVRAVTAFPAGLADARAWLRRSK
jgi:uncharacterized DUF497 family protein